MSKEAHREGVLSRNETVKDIMDTWTERPGFPVVTAIADYEKKQNPYFSGKSLTANQALMQSDNFLLRMFVLNQQFGEYF
ncbi:hypothetical protein NQ314_003099 [Rhamnusium bicolor]|uniref:Uncharacterized protein n=1 Tax=Rhamnusium bicolor TaxID=1586634 RepID=A0AAV8ZPY9_9CUCU|nr:hypothetical protein NQ314_003099 [Rhamnusium bicolor]